MGTVFCLVYLLLLEIRVTSTRTTMTNLRERISPMKQHSTAIRLLHLRNHTCGDDCGYPVDFTFTSNPSPLNRQRSNSFLSMVTSVKDSAPIILFTDDIDEYASGSNQNDLMPLFIASGSSKSKVDKYRTRDFRVRWFLLSKHTRLTILIVLSLLFSSLCVLVFAGVADALFSKYNLTYPAISTATNFDVVINTFKRPKMLVDAVRHYADTCGLRYGVNHIYIVWAEEGVTPPTKQSFFQETNSRQSTNRSGVTIVETKNSLNSRFLPIVGIKDSVFMVDDDIRVDCRHLAAAFAAWKSHPNSLVGFYPRLSQNSWLESDSKLVYHSWPIVFWRRQLNMILTKASFLHRRYMDLYSSDNHPKQIKDFVDKYFNCEDIAMAMLVANVTRYESKSPSRPIYVEGKVSDLGLFSGISTGTGHMTRRSDCLNQLTGIYRDYGWNAPLDASFSLSDSSWFRHYPGFWWQYRPSQFFEWFALSNVLQ